MRFVKKGCAYVTPREDLIGQLQQTPVTLRTMTTSLSEDALDFRPTLQDWSSREILAHLVDDEMFVMRTRLERIVKEDEPHLAPHDEQHWYATRNTARDALGELLDDFALQRAASMNIITLLRASDWQRMGFQPEYGRFTAAAWLERWVEHDHVHLKQIADNLAAFHETGA